MLLSTSQYTQDLMTLYQQIIAELIKDYDIYRNHIAGFLGALEGSSVIASAISTSIFFDLEPAATGLKNLTKPDNSFMDSQFDNTADDKLRAALSEALAADNKISLHSFKIPVDSFSPSQAETIAHALVHNIQEATKKAEWTLEDVSDWYFYLAVLRQFLLKLNNAEGFYHAAGMLLDRLASSELFQTGRDICEDLLMASFTDGVPELGFFSSFRFYSITSNAQAALAYANLTFYATLQRGTASTRFIRELVWQSMKMFRELEMARFAIQVYEQKPQLVFESDYDRHALDHTFFTVLLSIKAPELPGRLFEYLNQERESIFGGGVHDAVPWLVTLYNIRRLYGAKTKELELLNQYVTTLEYIVPEDAIQKVRSIIQGSINDLKPYLIASLQKLYSTRSVDDFVYDNDLALKISGRIIPSSVAEQDASAYLLAMVIRSDFSILFISKKAGEATPLLPSHSQQDDESVYKRYIEETEPSDIFALAQTEEITWLSLVEGSFYQLSLADAQFSFHESSAWKNKLYRKAVDSDLFAGLGFDTTTKDRRGEVRQVYAEEHEQASQELAETLSFAQVNARAGKSALFVVKDMELAGYPHNLFLNQEGQFIHSNRAITNIISGEWFSTNAGRHKLSANYSKAIWIPSRSGDIALNLLLSNIESTLSKNGFSVSDEVDIDVPLSSELNIVCSHGARNISETQIVSQTILAEDHEEAAEHFTFNLNSVAGKGKVLVFFVCHSGSMRAEFFRNSISSLVKRYLREGYGAVIAPAWALHVHVPKVWLPAFLDGLNDGQDISTATFRANMAVREVYPTPAAWACLHLYGDPHLSVTTSPES